MPNIAHVQIWTSDVQMLISIPNVRTNEYIRQSTVYILIGFHFFRSLVDGVVQCMSYEVKYLTPSKHTLQFATGSIPASGQYFYNYILQVWTQITIQPSNLEWPSERGTSVLPCHTGFIMKQLFSLKKQAITLFKLAIATQSLDIGFVLVVCHAA